MSQDTLTYDDKKPVAYVRGIVVPLGRKPVSGTDILATMQNVLALDYEGNDESKLGLSKIEAGLKELGRRIEEGDIEAMKFYIERIAGKPIQQINNFNVNADLKDFLAGVAKKRKETVPPAIDPLGD